MDPAKLQAHLLSSLATLPNVDPIHVTTLISAPRRVHDLYPHTPSPPRCFQLDYFLTLGVETDKVEEHGAIEEKQGRQEGRSVGGGKVESGEDAGGVNPDQTAGNQPSSAAVPATKATTGSQQTDTRPKAKTHLLVSSIFAHLYIIPSLSQSILYISKVDSSSYGPPVPLPLTRTFVAAFISHFLLPPNRPTSTLRIQLFARSQGQYLFPNSVENPRKKASISGGRLCGWWKGVYEEAVRMAVSPSPAPASVSAASFSGGEAVNAGDTAALSGSLAEKKPPMEGERLNVEDVRLSYLLPSYSAHEAHCLLGNPKNPLPAGVAWSYEPPFPPKSTTPITGEMGKNVNIADLIPSLEDDPKQRFLDELALNNKPAETEKDGRTAKPVAFPAREGESSSSVSVTTAEGQAAASAPRGDVATDEPQKTHPRSLSNSNGHGHGGHGKRSYAQEQNAKEEEALRRTSHAALALTSYEEYWERLGYRQECAQDTTGFFSCVVGGPRLAPQVVADMGPTNGTPSGSAAGGSSVPAVVPRPADPTSRRFQLSPTIVERLHKALLNTDFINISLAQAGSAFWMDSMRRIVSDEIGAEGLKACTGTVEAKDPKVGAEEAAKRKADKVEAVTMLQPRKKKRG